MQSKYLTVFLGVALALTMIITALVIIIIYSEKQLADAWAVLPTTSKPAFQLAQSNGSYNVPFIMIADQDKRSKIQKGFYAAPSVRGYLNYNLNSFRFQVTYDSVYNYTSNYAFADKGMELSDLKYYKGYLIAPDDKTGILFKMTPTKAIPWVINVDGDGESDMSFKAEWITEKDNLLYVGSHGTEQVMRKNESVMDENRMWIKIVDSQGHVEHRNWKTHYTALRNALNITFPGYIAHEACQWSKIHKKWFFLPRRLSHEVFHPLKDGYRSTNVLMIVEEDFSNIDVIEIGAVVPERGYSAFQFVPDSNDTIIFALKTVEAVNLPVETYASVFDIKGNVLLPDVVIPFPYKLEGLEFFDFTQQEWL